MTKIFLYGSIDLTKISPKIAEVSDLNYEFQQFAQKSSKNGHIYLSVNTSDSQQPSEYSTHYIACKKKGEKAIGVGSLKEFVRNDAPQQQPQATPTAQSKSNDPDDIPF
jgi:hypothetical protein